MAAEDVLPIAIAAWVPLRIRQYAAQGGPEDHDLLAMRTFAARLAEHGDMLLYGGAPGEAAKLSGQLVDALAVLAFAPGGVTAFGQHFEAVQS